MTNRSYRLAASARATALLAGLCIAISFSGCAQRSRVMFAPQPIAIASHSVAERHTDVRALIRQALRDYDWGVEKDAPGLLIAKQSRGEFSARVKIVYNAKTVQISYLDSENLLYQVDERGTPRIHGRYNTWMTNLVRRITALVQ